jgi:MFS transporter, putative metabolite:H+ symporter
VSGRGFVDTGSIDARIDALSMTPRLWMLVAILAAGAFFEAYDMALTAILPPALARAGIFSATDGLLGLPDQAAFGAATFVGVFAGALLLGRLADRSGRKRIFVVALLFYTGATIAMALQGDAFWIDVCRGLAGIGFGATLVTIDAYVADLVPARFRGRAFAFAALVQFLGVPVAGALGVALMRSDPLGIDAWRWLCAFGGLALGVAGMAWRYLPESPRWLALRGEHERADAIVAMLERGAGISVSAVREARLPEPAGIPANGGCEVLSSTQRRRRLAMLVTLHVFSTIGFYGLGNWLPTLVAAQGHPIAKSVEYTVYIALCYPLCPLVFLLFADRVERKWQIVAASLLSGVLGFVFVSRDSAAALIATGIALTFFNLLSAYASHAYQAEIFPPAIRARAVGFAYSWGRLAAAFSSLLIGWLLKAGGVWFVFAFLALAQLIAALAVALLGPRTLVSRRKTGLTMTEKGRGKVWKQG